MVYAYLYTQLLGDASYAADAGICIGIGCCRPCQCVRVHEQRWSRALFEPPRPREPAPSSRWKTPSLRRASRTAKARRRRSARRSPTSPDRDEFRALSDRDDAYVLVGHIDAEGTVRVIFPLDPAGRRVRARFKELSNPGSVRGLHRRVPATVQRIAVFAGRVDGFVRSRLWLHVHHRVVAANALRPALDGESLGQRSTWPRRTRWTTRARRFRNSRRSSPVKIARRTRWNSRATIRRRDSTRVS